jgi:hypothetical protein
MSRGGTGTDTLILVNGDRCEAIDARDAGLPYFGRIITDVQDRTETAMSQAHCFKVMELALQAQAMAEGRAMIRVAIIGAGIGAEHLAGYRALPERFSVATLCDLDTERATAVAGSDAALHIVSDIAEFFWMIRSTW